MQNEIQDSAFQSQLDFESGADAVVGVNRFHVEEEIVLESLKLDPAIEANQREKLAVLRSNRDNEKVANLLAALTEAAKGETNMMPLLIECVENQITLGEICNMLRKVWGEYRAPNFL